MENGKSATKKEIDDFLKKPCNQGIIWSGPARIFGRVMELLDNEPEACIRYRKISQRKLKITEVDEI